MMFFLKWYNRVLQVHPWKTQLLTTGILMGTSDIISQTAIEKCKFKEIEVTSIGRFFIMGSCFVAPVLRVWYNALEKSIAHISKAAGLQKMLMDQFVFTPVFLCCFLILSGVLQFQSWEVSKSKINNEYFSILKRNYMLWPAAQLVTFYIIPHHYRIIFVSFIALIWNTYLASQANRSYMLNSL